MCDTCVVLLTYGPQVNQTTKAYFMNIVAQKQHCRKLSIFVIFLKKRMMQFWFYLEYFLPLKCFYFIFLTTLYPTYYVTYNLYSRLFHRLQNFTFNYIDIFLISLMLNMHLISFY
uniref:Uncharacterized protein n=1 Tax=Pararge aegeria TaxID=116150 RepID=S4PFN8_9NEOP